MNKKQTGCKYKGCPHPVYTDGWCIFHLPKLTDNEKRELSTEEKVGYNKLEEKFREEFFTFIKKIEGELKVEVFNFKGFHFVEIDLSNDNILKKLGEFEFNKRVDFYGAKFIGKVNFQKICFKGITNFREASFYDNASFEDTVFNGKADFFSATFKESSFVGANFKEIVQFSLSKFNGEANFVGVTYKGKAIYEKASFNDAFFSLSSFEKEADFEEAIFKTDAHFYNVKFEKANFFKTIFNGKANFYEADFKEANFVAATFEGTTIFRGSEGSDLFKENFDFIGIYYDPLASIIFEKVNLKKASFLDTNIENFIFRDVKWCGSVPLYKWFNWLRIRKTALWDEIRDDVKIDYSKLSENYHQLVLNYDRKRDFDKALEFRIGEMEVKRNSKITSDKKFIRFFQHVFNAHALYKLLSSYGTSYWQAFIWLILFLLIFSGIFMLSGFETLTPAGTTETVVSYNISLNPSNWVSFGNCLSDLGKSILFTLSVLTLQKARFFAPLGGWSQFWLCIATIVFYSQIAITLLAIRRRFKQ